MEWNLTKHREVDVFKKDNGDIAIRFMQLDKDNQLNEEVHIIASELAGMTKPQKIAYIKNKVSNLSMRITDELIINDLLY